MPNYYFLEKIFFIGPILGKLYSVYAERGFSCKLGEKIFVKKLKYDPS